MLSKIWEVVLISLLGLEKFRYVLVNGIWEANALNPPTALDIAALFMSLVLKRRELQQNKEINKTKRLVPVVNDCKRVDYVSYQPVSDQLRKSSHYRCSLLSAAVQWHRHFCCQHEATDTRLQGEHYSQTVIVLTHTERPVQVGNSKVWMC